MYPPFRPEAQLSMCFIHIAYHEDGNCQAQGWWNNVKHSYIWDMHASRRSMVCIARAAANESVCEDSHAEHMQFATAAVSV